MYRDDLRRQPTRPVGHTRLPIAVDDAVVVLVDDVLFSGRTVRAALDALGDLGRPRAVRLAVSSIAAIEKLPSVPTTWKNLQIRGSTSAFGYPEEVDGVNEVTIVRDDEVRPELSEARPMRHLPSATDLDFSPPPPRSTSPRRCHCSRQTP